MIRKNTIDATYHKAHQNIRSVIRQVINKHQSVITSISLMLVFVMTGAATVDAPESQISNGIITADLKLPDAKDGYYRGVRFDWSGVISDLTYKGHHYFGKWFDRYEPTLHDAIMGPVDAYDPIGYDLAKPGEAFVKIGVGTVEKIADEPYAFVKPYKLLNGGKWQTKKKGKSSIQYEHVLKDPLCSYRYVKTITLSEGKPEMVIEYRLRNTGTNRIETSVFNHNFFVFDEQPIGPDFTVTFPFTPSGEPKGKPTAGILDGKVIRYREVINKGEQFAVAPLTGFGSGANDYDLVVSNEKTKMSVRIVGDQPIVKFVYWSSARTLCPEPYTRVVADPGKEINWKITYTFSADEVKN
ncbi:hypothetical protein WBG78_14570 [Chryseolinea sp. T2]|uniref:hypothetical protein n=1 Tax=Chryseolinea sp. T2 TaxID=3129255 RepID=UPI0030773EC9